MFDKRCIFGRFLQYSDIKSLVSSKISFLHSLVPRRSRRALPGSVGCHSGTLPPRHHSLELSHLGKGRDSSSLARSARHDRAVGLGSPYPGLISLCCPQPVGHSVQRPLLTAARAALPSSEGTTAGSELGPRSVSTSSNPRS